MSLAQIISTVCASSVLAVAIAAGAEPPEAATTQPQQIVPLWSDSVPGAHGTDPAKDIPTLTLYLPSPGKATGAGMIVCPGGGYAHLAPHEGKDYAIWLQSQGIAAFVLQSRLGSAGYHHPAMLQDVQRAIRVARFHASEWKFNPKQLGIIGSSAGGHLASTAATHFDAGQADASDPIDRQDSRPDLCVLCYPVITMGDETHQGSRTNLLGENPSPELIALLSNELHVTKDTPPCFIWSTADDNVVPVENSLAFAAALSKNKVPFEIHIYEHGAHGLGLGVHSYDPATTDPHKLLPWTGELTRWLKTQHFTR